jgi:hypothetical protein
MCAFAYFLLNSMYKYITNSDIHYKASKGTHIGVHICSTHIVRKQDLPMPSAT